MDVKISEIIALLGVLLYSVVTILPDILGKADGKSKKQEQ